MFKLYKVQQHSFMFPDYETLMKEARGAKSALEFGPGISTLALIEAGVERIVTCEHDAEWLQRANERFEEYPHVKVIRYLNEPEAKAEIEGEFDIALVDSPKGYSHTIPGIKGKRTVHPGQEDCSRLNTCLLALKHSPKVYLHDAIRPLERGTLGRLQAMGHKVTFIPCRAGLARIDRNGREDTNRPGAQSTSQSGSAAQRAKPRSRRVQLSK